MSRSTPSATGRLWLASPKVRAILSWLPLALALPLLAMLLWQAPAAITWLAQLAETSSHLWVRVSLGFAAVTAEAFFPVVPLAPLVAINVFTLGFWGGLLLSWLGALAGASGCYWLARLLGHAWVMQRLHPSLRDRLNRLATNLNFRALLLGWFLPGVNLVVSYAAGLGGVPFWRFLLAGALGLFPWVAIYAALAHDLARAGVFGGWLAAGAVLLVGLWLAWRFASKLRPARALGDA